MEVAFGIIGWIVLSFVIYAVANSKGRSGCAWFFISLLLSPLIAIIILVCVGDSDEKKEASLRKAVNVIESERARENNEHEGMTKDKAIEELQKAKKLLELEVISQEEYNAKKAELLPYLRDDYVAPKEEDSEVVEEPIIEEATNTEEINEDPNVEKETIGNEPWYNKTGVQIAIISVVVLLVVGGLTFAEIHSQKKREMAKKEKIVSKPQPVGIVNKTKGTHATSQNKKKSDEDIVIIGRWSLKSVYNSAIEIVEIYKKDGKYYSKERGGQIILLNKIGDRYYYTGMDYANDSYYKIVNGKLRICDDELGDYTEDSGYIITKLK